MRTRQPLLVSFPVVPKHSPGTQGMTTANKITLARILLIPVFVVLAIYYGRSLKEGAPQPWERWSAVAVFTLAAASDGVDGYIARRFNQRSRLGVILDPLADKGLLLAGLVTLSISSWTYEIPPWFPVLVISRDVVVLAGAIVLHLLNGSVRVRASWVGKCATAMQMVSLVLVMLELNPFTSSQQLGPLHFTLRFLDLPIWLAGIFTAISGVQYIIEGIAQMHDGGHGDPAGHNQAVTVMDTTQAPK